MNIHFSFASSITKVLYISPCSISSPHILLLSPNNNPCFIINIAMKLLTLFFLFLAAMAIVAALDLEDYNEDMDMQSRVTVPENQEQEAASLRGVGRFLSQYHQPANMTCNKFPWVCRLKNSQGRDCCNKKCVNVITDRMNCGGCGCKCKYSEICCKGKCVNTSFDKRHCGGCNKKCKKGELCVYGMCNYAWLISLLYILCNCNTFMPLASSKIESWFHICQGYC